MPVYNGELYLAEAIESVLGQSYRPLELIVVDDGSTDRSAAIAARYASNEVSVVRQPNRGTAAARNAGLAIARGELLAHLDADDVWIESKLRLQIQALTVDPAMDIACGLVAEFLSPELTERERRRLRPHREPIRGYVLGAMLVRRAAHDLVGPFETSWQVGQDMAWLLRAKELGLRFVEVPEIVVRRRLHLSNKGRRHPDLATQRCRMLKESLDRCSVNVYGIKQFLCGAAQREAPPICAE
jgi:glycosyltransferase involved in cell wall biosynthesis